MISNGTVYFKTIGLGFNQTCIYCKFPCTHITKPTMVNHANNNISPDLLIETPFLPQDISKPPSRAGMVLVLKALTRFSRGIGACSMALRPMGYSGQSLLTTRPTPFRGGNVTKGYLWVEYHYQIVRIKRMDDCADICRNGESLRLTELPCFMSVFVMSCQVCAGGNVWGQELCRMSQMGWQSIELIISYKFHGHSMQCPMENR